MADGSSLETKRLRDWETQKLRSDDVKKMGKILISN